MTWRRRPRRASSHASSAASERGRCDGDAIGPLYKSAVRPRAPLRFQDSCCFRSATQRGGQRLAELSQPAQRSISLRLALTPSPPSPPCRRGPAARGRPSSAGRTRCDGAVRQGLQHARCRAERRAVPRGAAPPVVGGVRGGGRRQPEAAAARLGLHVDVAEVQRGGASPDANPPHALCRCAVARERRARMPATRAACQRAAARATSLSQRRRRRRLTALTSC